MLAKYCKWMESNPRLIKLILCFWILDITWAIYRIGRALVKNNAVHLVLAILWILAAATLGWILDIVWIIVYNRPFWFND